MKGNELTEYLIKLFRLESCWGASGEGTPCEM